METNKQTNIDGKPITGTGGENVRVKRRIAQSLWHDRVGYKFLHPVSLSVDATPRQSNWSAIGTSEGDETHDLMIAYFEHPHGEQNDQLFTYTAHLDISVDDFHKLAKNVLPEPEVTAIRQRSRFASAIVRGAVYGQGAERIVSLVFLTGGYYSTGLEDIRRVETDGPILLMFQRNENNNGWILAVADPSQLLITVLVQVYIGTSQEPIVINVDLPKGPWAGSMSRHEF